jgi:hypothetical protein
MGMAYLSTFKFLKSHLAKKLINPPFIFCVCHRIVNNDASSLVTNAQPGKIDGT